MDIRWRKMLLFMGHMILSILERGRNFLSSSVSCLRDFLFGIVASWNFKKDKGQPEQFLLKKYMIIMCIPLKVLFVGQNTMIFTSLSDISKNLEKNSVRLSFFIFETTLKKCKLMLQWKIERIFSLRNMINPVRANYSMRLYLILMKSTIWISEIVWIVKIHRGHNLKTRHKLC